MDARRAFVTQVLEQLVTAVRELSDADFERLMRGELEASVSFVRPAAAETEAGRRRQAVRAGRLCGRGVRGGAGEAGGGGQPGGGAADRRGYAFAGKEQLFAFAKWLDLPVQRNDAATRIRDKVVTYAVGRRLSGRAVRGGAGVNGCGDGEA